MHSQVSLSLCLFLKTLHTGGTYLNVQLTGGKLSPRHSLVSIAPASSAGPHQSARREGQLENTAEWHDLLRALLMFDGSRSDRQLLILATHDQSCTVAGEPGVPPDHC